LKKITVIFWFTLTLVLQSGYCSAQEQNAGGLSTAEIEKYRTQITGLVKYLEGTFNFIGDPNALPKEKEIIIQESYLKVFRDDKVQIEDDLDKKRDVPMHKDVQAYLKDIEFFFSKAVFQFMVLDINYFVNENNIHYFKVSFNRDLNAVTVAGDTLQSRLLRYMEINVDIAKSDLKIASIYSTKLNEREEAGTWWNELEPEWKYIFAGNDLVFDSIKMADIIYIGDSLLLVANPPAMDQTGQPGSEIPAKPDSIYLHAADTLTADTLFINTSPVYSKLFSILNLQKIDVSGNINIRNLDPLNKMAELREINASGTLVTSLFPIRNLNRLETLDFSNTPVDDLHPIHFSTSLTALNLSYTLISDITPLGNLVNLEKLECAGIRLSDPKSLGSLAKLKTLDLSETSIQDLSALKNLVNLTNLNVSGSKIRNLGPLEKLIRIKYLNLENTSVNSLEEIKNLHELEVLYISDTEIDNLRAVSDLENLTKIYCDNTPVSKDETIQFMKDHPGCLVIFESEELLKSWNELEKTWKEIATEVCNLSEPPTKEELHQLLRIEELDLSGKDVTNLKPVKRLFNLKYLNISGILADDYNPLGEAVQLAELNLSGTSVTDLAPLKNLKQLQVLNIENTKISKLDPLSELTGLKIIYADQTGLTDAEVIRYRQSNPGCIVVYKSDELNSWWGRLSEGWKGFFTGEFRLDSPPDTEQLHSILYLDSLSITGQDKISSLDPLKICLSLKTLMLSRLQISDLMPVSGFKHLKSLQFTQMPVAELLYIGGLPGLESLNFENTPVEDLKPLEGLTTLKELKFSGTNVSSLKPLSGLTNLERLEMNNTQVKSLKPVEALPALKSVQCYNTRISQKNVDSFKSAKPGCEVIFY
jgi:Leucine-rich repeat (LRR) protein